MIINLKEFYPEYYPQDFFIEVEKEVAFALHHSLTLERRWQDRRKYNNDVYSLDAGDNIESEILNPQPGTPQIAEAAAVNRRLKLALNSLSDKQLRRVFLHCILDMKYSEIAKSENIKESTIRQSIAGGLAKLRKFFKDF